MAQTDTQNLRQAREIVAGRRNLTVPQLLELAYALREENQIGYARRIYRIALPLAAPEMRDRIQVKLALATYKDTELPVDDRLKTAESLLLDVLSRTGILTVDQRQETLGLLGAVYKQRWSIYGHKEHLEKALYYYRSGYQLGITSDFGYTAINTAFVLDLLADERIVSGEPSHASQSRATEAAQIRTDIITTLPTLMSANSSLEGQWWFDCTLGEAYLGLRRIEEARVWVQKAAAAKPDNWRLESTARQMAHIVRLQSKADKLPLERWIEAPGFEVLSDLLGGSAAAAMSFFLGKVGLALSGGGFRASLYHIGVLAQLAELDMLRHIEVISCVSGGSILGAYYYLELRRLLQTKPDSEIKREDYIQIVKNVESGFLAGVQKNLRLRMFLEPGSNWKVLTSRTSTTTDRLGDLYERELYARVQDEFAGNPQRFIQDLKVHPAGTGQSGFTPRYDNWRRLHKVPILILNATILNTCHSWQFTATYMGEPPLRAIDNKIDANDRLRRMYYDQAPQQFQRIRLGQAVAASACVPGLFDPLVLDGLYPDYATKLVDGGVYDNQGASSLRDEDCTILLISDASGQTGLVKEPQGERIQVSLRSNNVLMARSRQEQYQLLSALTDAGALRGVAYVHLKKDLDPQPVDWIGCPDPSMPEAAALLTTYGIRKDLQLALATIRTDLDGFSDAEADALMFSGYSMFKEEFAACIKGFPKAEPIEPAWRFLRIAPLASAQTDSLELQELRRTLAAASSLAFKPYRLSTAIKLTTWTTVAAALAGLVFLLLAVRGRSVSVAGASIVIVLLVAIYGSVKLVVNRLVRNPNPLWQILLAIPLLVLGWPLTLLSTKFLDPVYLRSGPTYKP